MGYGNRYLVVWHHGKFLPSLALLHNPALQANLITQLISLIWGNNWHIFKPDGVTIDGEDYPAHVITKQADYFGPFPPSYQEIADDERLATLTFINNYSTESGKWKPFKLAEDPELTKLDRDFICKIMKLDPRDRPTAAQLLHDEWFHST